jgi:hypothetical protein
MKRHLLLAVVALIIGASRLTYADEPTVSGHTAASDALIAKIRSGIYVFAVGTMGCGHIKSIDVGPLPSGVDPKTIWKVPATLVRAPQPPVVYELWSLKGCSRPASIIVQLWRTDKGEDMYALIGMPTSAERGP